MDSDKDNMVNFKDFSSIMGIICLGDFAEKMKLIYRLHQPPALLENDLDPDVAEEEVEIATEQQGMTEHTSKLSCIGE